MKNYICKLLNLTGMVGEVEQTSNVRTAAFYSESWNVNNKYTWDNAGDVKQLSMDQTLSGVIKRQSQFLHGKACFLITAVSHKRFLQSAPGEL